MSSAIASAVRWLQQALGYLAAKGDDRVNAVTFFTTQVDFEKAGDLRVFVDDEQIEVDRRAHDGQRLSRRPAIAPMPSISCAPTT